MQTINTDLSQALVDIGAVISALVGWMNDVFAFFLAQPILVLLLGLMLFGAAVSFVMRLIYRH